MEINNLFGLPAHPLIVHAPVVLILLAFIGTILMAIKPSWRHRYGWPTAVMALIGAIGVQLAMGSGESLEKRVEKSNLIEKHSQIAEQARPFVFAFALLLVVIVVWDLLNLRKDKAAGTDEATSAKSTTGKALVGLTIVAAILGGVATYEIVQTGHSGAKAAWHDTPPARAGGGEGGEGKDKN